MSDDTTPRESRTAQVDGPNRRRVLKAAAAGAATMVGVAGAATAGEGGDVGTEVHCCRSCQEYFCCTSACRELCHRCTCRCDDDELP